MGAALSSKKEFFDSNAEYANQVYDLKRLAKERLAEYVDHDTTLERKEKLGEKGNQELSHSSLARSLV